jgi:hypothetical protein
MILRGLDQLEDGAALRRPLAERRATNGKIHSALNRAPGNTRRDVAAATAENFLHVWNAGKSS